MRTEKETICKGVAVQTEFIHGGSFVRISDELFATSHWPLAKVKVGDEIALFTKSTKADSFIVGEIVAIIEFKVQVLNCRHLRSAPKLSRTHKKAFCVSASEPPQGSRRPCLDNQIECYRFPGRWDQPQRLHFDLKTLAIFAGEERVGLGVADDFSFGWVPFEFAVQTHGDVGEVADFEHAVVGPDVGDRLLARLHSFDEVRGVVLADFSTVDFFDSSFG